MVDIFKAERAVVYHNPRRLTPKQIQAETGCTHIINGYLFNNRFQPLGWTVIEGEVLSQDEYSDWGFGFGGSVKPWGPEMTTDRTENFLSGVPILKNGSRLHRDLTPDVARRAERTAVGWTEDKRVVLWCDKEKLIVNELQQRLLELGCVDALMLDGGGSTQGIFPGESVISSRKVPTLLLFWEKQEPIKKEEDKPMVEINAYSLARDGKTYLAKNFQVKEFACKDGSDPVMVAKYLPMVLQYIRMRAGKAVNINSAYRTPQHNAQEGGVADSQHCYGAAADIRISGVKPAAVAAWAREIMPDWGGVGIYSNFTHIDVREEKADW